MCETNSVVYSINELQHPPGRVWAHVRPPAGSNRVPRRSGPASRLSLSRRGWCGDTGVRIGHLKGCVRVSAGARLGCRCCSDRKYARQSERQGFYGTTVRLAPCRVPLIPAGRCTSVPHFTLMLSQDGSSVWTAGHIALPAVGRRLSRDESSAELRRSRVWSICGAWCSCSRAPEIAKPETDHQRS